ncbi:MAG: UDP-N-acetylmuramoyl-L-alanyl-D-glutamate--2 6-diaminopimelate ligase [Candidatus Saganbacteria bacterium]|uniref:UDP-N-acetylmuramyl-tripeptide synthetase n=1 Tax=Candidatus Saganbacteria bacterium TaxID=2575572 RepID=A0A833L2K0_UNCSA|nr:MAG: UDP-N-acetylmuramoyl-L-alanyl-D-glutamate--2 6-diaminopimelate ligase [Candidatus Saganbacteria bacterium]
MSEAQTINLYNFEIKGIAYDSRKIKKGDVFVAIPGLKFDGASFIPQAIENGASVIICETETAVPDNVKLIKVANARQALAELSAKYYGYPASKLKIIGITGTNGKTTIAYFIESILKEAGYKVGLISTVETKINNKSMPSSFTTPESLELQEILSQMVKEGITHVVMEVSSHALAQDRVYGLQFDEVIFTNLTHEHLDFHKTMDEYLSAKLKIFKMLKHNGTAVINVDDPSSKKIIESIDGEVVFYGMKDIKHELRSTKTSNFDVRLKEYDIKFELMRVRIDTTEIRTAYIGIYNIYNLLAAFQCGLVLNIEKKKIKAGIEKAVIPGRFERIDVGQDLFVIIDFAHTPDGLQKLLGTIKPLIKGKIILVFGCPGDRDKEKRPIMGKIAADLADQMIVTTDDPHSENPQQIIDEILTGIDPRYALRVSNYVDRKEAIKRAISIAQKGDVVVLAGRGHEKRQDFNGKKVEFDDVKIAKEAIKLNGKS